MSNKNNNNSGFDRFRDRHPILVSIPLMILALIALGYIALLFIDVFTSHGQQVQVPDVRNMPLEKAIEILDNAGLNWEISDSTTFYEQYKPGLVLEQDPKPKSYIKKIRPIYLNVNAAHAPFVALPRLKDLPGRQGMAALRAMGYKHVELDSVPSPMEGLILQVTVNGREVAPGTKISVNSLIKIIVGDGSIKDLTPEQYYDNATMDSIDSINFIQDQQYYEQLRKERAAQERKRQAAQQRNNQNAAAEQQPANNDNTP